MSSSICVPIVKFLNFNSSISRCSARNPFGFVLSAFDLFFSANANNADSGSLFDAALGRKTRFKS